MLRDLHMYLRCIWVRASACALLLWLGATRVLAEADGAVAAPGAEEAEAAAAADAGADAGRPRAATGPLPGAPDAAAAPAEIIPPQLLHSPPPVFPEAKLSSGEHPTVVL